jgi:hypothetical protein
MTTPQGDRENPSIAKLATKNVAMAGIKLKSKFSLHTNQRRIASTRTKVP